MPTNAQPANPIARLFRPDPSRDLFRVLADSLGEAVFVLNNNADSLLACNHAFLLLSGYGRAEVENLSPGDLFPGVPGESTLAQLTSPWEGPELRLEQTALKPRQGEILLVDLSGYGVGSPRAAILVKARLSRERLEQDDRARTQGRLLQTMAEATAALLDTTSPPLPSILNHARALLSADSVGLYRVSAAAPDYTLEGLLPEEFPSSLPSTALDPLQRPSSWALGQRPEHPLHKAARASGLNALRSAPLGSAIAWIGVLVAGWHEQDQVPAEADALMSLIANLCHEAVLLGVRSASLAELQQGLDDLEAELRVQSGAVSEGILVLDPDLRVVRANAPAAALLGYQDKEMIGLAVQDVLVGPTDVLATLLDARGHERRAEQSGLTFHHRDGTPFPAQLRAAPIGPGRSRLLVVLSDRSERQAIADQTEVLAQRALLGEVSAIFAHEVRNPINNISTGVQLIASRLREGDPQREALERIRRECVRLDQLMRDVLFFARPLELKMEPIDLADMMKRLLERWKPRFTQAGVRCHTAFEPGTPAVAADPRTLEQVVVNLINNALQAMTAGGTLSVTLAPASAAQGDMVELKIADTGPGIPPDVIDRIFDPFFTTKKDGTGLGLAISRRIITAHNGGLSVESYADAGTVFKIRLPAEAGLAEGAPA